MSAEAKEVPTREGWARATGRATAFASLGGAAFGLAEAAKVLAGADARYVQWACKLVAIGALGNALLGALLALPCAAFACALAGRPQHRVARASDCAGLGAALAVLAYSLGGWIPFLATLPAALAGTAIALALRELLAWWPVATRLRTWWSLVGVAGSGCVALIALEWASGAVRWTALALAAINLAFAIGAFFGRRVPQAATFGVLALIVLAAGSHPERRLPEVSTAGQSDVLIVSIDTLRADHLGCYGREGARTPVIDQLACEGVLFEDATVQANTTGPSHATILTGLYPAEHGALSNGVRLSHRARTLADVLGRTHSTAGFVSGFTLVEESCGFAERFDWYDDQMLAWTFLPRVAERLHLVREAIRCAESRGHDVRRADRPANETVDRAIEWLSTRGDEPLFTFVHLYDPHAPYEPPAEFAKLHDPSYTGSINWYELDTRERDALVSDPQAVARMRALYAGEISFADAEVGRLLDALRDSGRLERTLVVLTSDHGEGLGAHGYWFDHGTYLYDEELRVPLVLRLPNAQHAGTRVKGQVRSLDIAATVLDVLGTPTSLATSGASLLPLLADPPEPRDRPSFAIADISGDVSGFPIDGRRLSLRTKGHKLIFSSSHWLDTTRVNEREEFYDLARDPDELDDLRANAQVPSLPFADMHEDLGRWREATADLDLEAPKSADVIEQLRKLGYL